MPHRSRKEQSRPTAQPESAERRLGLGLDRPPKVRKAGAFDFILSTAKQDITGVKTLPRDRRHGLFRYGAWLHIDPTRAELQRWFRDWVRGGGLAILNVDGVRDLAVEPHSFCGR